MKRSPSLAALVLLVPVLAAAPAAASSVPEVCTVDIVESIAVCVTEEDDGDVCVRVNVGPSYVVDRCVPLSILDVLSPCFHFALVPLDVCIERTADYVCVDVWYEAAHFRRCVRLPAADASSEDAKPFCRVGEHECVGSLACLYPTEPDLCVPDPCYRTVCWRVASAESLAAAPKCVVLVPEGGDMGEKVCVDLAGACKVYYERTTFIGTWRICLVPPGSSGGPETESTTSPPACADRYWETGVGPVRVVSPDTCTYHGYVYGRRVL